MGSIRVFKIEESHLWAISSSYFSKALVKAAKAVPGMNFDYTNRRWWGYLDAVAATVARLNYEGISVVGDDKLPAPDAWKESRTPYLFAVQDRRPYQVEGIHFLIVRSHEGALLADGMRLGKSCEATTAARAFKSKTLIVCPSHLTGVWGRPPEDRCGPGEIAKWWPDAWKPHPESGARGVVRLESIKPAKAQKTFLELNARRDKLSEKELETCNAAEAELIARSVTLQDAQVIICHFDVLYAWVEVLKRWGFDTIIIDEVHLFAGYKSRRMGALMELRNAARRAMTLTGTPVTNLAKNAFNILEITCPGRFGYFFSAKNPNAGHFSRVFCGLKFETVGSGTEQKTAPNFKGASNIDTPDGEYALTKEETLAHRVKYLMLRRVKKDVDPQLPEKKRDIIDVTIDARQTIGVTRSMFDSGGKELRRVLDLAADGKFSTVIKRCVEHMLEGEKVICFCVRRAFTEQVAKAIVEKTHTGAVDWIHGGITSIRERDRIIHELRSYDGPVCLVGTIDTISTGIDLSFASIGVVGELSWEHDVLAQMEERLYAFGKEQKSLLEYIIARSTGDELILKAIIEKIGLADRIVGSAKDNMREDLSRKKVDSMKRLYETLVEMQKAKPEPGSMTRRRR
jgi:hypothetical protein